MAIYDCSVLATGVDVSDPAMPILSSDSIVDGQTLFLFDLGNTDCFPLQANVTADYQLRNLVPAMPSGLANYLTAAIPFVAGGLQLNPTNRGSIEYATSAGDTDISAMGNPPVLLCQWVEMSAATIAAYGNCGGNYQLGFATGGNAYAGVRAMLNGAIIAGLDTPLTQGAKTQVALAWLPNPSAGTAELRLYANGVPVKSLTQSGAVITAAATKFGVGEGIMSGFTTPALTVYRSLFQRLDLIDETDVDAVVAADYSAGS